MDFTQMPTEAIEKPKIGEEEIRKASEILKRYKQGKARLEEKIIKNEQFWKLRQWNYIGRSDNEEAYQPSSSYLWSCIESRYSDAMDSYPTCNFQSRQKDDEKEAKMLSAIVPVILEQNRYEETYSDIVRYALKQGGCVQGVFWDGSKNNGMGDVSIKKIDYINLFWEPGITDLQDSMNLFNTELVDNTILAQRYPELEGKLGTNTLTLAKYLYDDSVPTDDKTVVIDWYYHTEYNGKKVLHYCKFIDGHVLYATENDTKVPTMVQYNALGEAMEVPTGEPASVRGLYDHAKYPFVNMALYPIEGSICGYGLTDIGRDAQISIDKLNNAIVNNAVIGATPRYFVKNDGSINEKEFRNLDNDLVHVEGQLNDEYIRAIEHKPLDGMYVNYIMQKIDELKYVTSNQDSNNGVAPSGVTAASAIAALQETAGKNARSSNKTFHRAFRDVCYQIVELIRQFYDLPRTFRIAPDEMLGGESQYVDYTNAGLKAQQQYAMVGGIQMETGLRLPEFDIDVTTEKANPYKKMEINELALSFYNAGFFNPQMADQAIQCLQMMDFTQKEDVIERIRQNGSLYQQLLMFQQLALTLAQEYDPQMADQIAQMMLQAQGQPIVAESQMIDPQAALQDESTNEHPRVEKARKQARESTEVE